MAVGTNLVALAAAHRRSTSIRKTDRRNLPAVFLLPAMSHAPKAEEALLVAVRADPEVDHTYPCIGEALAKVARQVEIVVRPLQGWREELGVDGMIVDEALIEIGADFINLLRDGWAD